MQLADGLGEDGIGRGIVAAIPLATHGEGVHAIGERTGGIAVDLLAQAGGSP